MRTRTILFSLLLLAASSTGAHALVAGSADDVCAPAANPCNVSTEVDVVNNATLDFGTRTVNVTGGGRFDFGSGNGKLLLGKLLTNTSGAVINANGPGSLPDTRESGLVQIEARRACSSGTRACVAATDCQLGSCNVRRCSLKSTRQCTTDSNCQLGTCIAPGMPNARRCTLSLATRCSTNSDCQLGTCPAQLTCAGEAENPVNCTTDANCDFGACSVGEGTIDLNSSINGSSDVPAIILMRAADDITLRKVVNMNSDALESDGGELELESFGGDIQTLSNINMIGGADATGGDLRVLATGNILINEDIDVSGGDFDGGAVELSAGVDLTVNKDIIANAISGAGFGGEILASAGRDMTVNGTSMNNRTRFATEGHTDATNFAGDGGTQELDSGRNMALNSFTRFEGNGSAPDGFGADLFVSAGGNFFLNGEIEAKSKGTKGSGGFIEVKVDGNAEVDPAGFIDLFGGEGGGGTFDLLAGGALDYAGTADVTGGSGGGGGSIRLDSEADAVLSGDLVTNGSSDGDLDITACRIRLTGTASMDNDSLGGDNRLTVGESMRLEAGSQVLAVNGGTNLFTYRAASKPPVINGTVTPAPILVVDPDLAGCPVCGNGELDEGETCDDSDTQSGDGCSNDCQNENCIAQTPGYPAVPLCDDGDGCTTDTCNTAVGGGTCQHSAGCNDGIPCTTDLCVEDTCQFTPVNSACVPSNACQDGVCSAATGCSFVNNNAPCNDGLFCTVNDTCSNGQCSGQARVCDDGIACTIDSCNEAADQCNAVPNNALCADDTFCDGAEVCDAETGCEEGTPVDCSGNSGQCAQGTCDEDANACTGDPINEGQNCDDGNFCTVDDTCQSGVCTGQARNCSDDVACTIDECSESTDTCTHEGSDALCQDDVFCDGSEICNVNSGCQDGTPVDCSGSSGSCTIGTCNEITDSCLGLPTNEGDPCDDGQFCTVGDACDNGVCTGDARDCSELDDQCHEGVCDEDSNDCEAQNANEGGGCDDGDECTLDDTCTAGVCAGDADPECEVVCGNGEVEEGEDCDDGNTQFVSGQYCGADCLRVPCGKPTDSNGPKPTASDALFVLKAAVGQVTCDVRLCNVDFNVNTTITASDSLRVLKVAVGQALALICPTTL